jgi:hypothetical protein
MGEAREIEITPEMIEAGASVLVSWLPDVAPFGTMRSLAERVFEAMLATSGASSILAAYRFGGLVLGVFIPTPPPS